MNTTNTTILDQDSTPEEYTKILRGRYITNITISDDEIRATTLELDNGDTLTIEGNEGCMGRVNGWYHLENAYKRGNHTARIMNAHVEYSQDDNYADGYEAVHHFRHGRRKPDTAPPRHPARRRRTRRIRHRLHTHRAPGRSHARVNSSDERARHTTTPRKTKMGEHAITTNNRATLNQDSTPEEYAALLKGRYVTDITVSSDEASATITLDNGTTLELIGSWGRSCGNGATYVKHVFQQGNRTARIMNARVETTHDDERYYETDYTLFVTINGNPTQLPLATMQGYDENGYYGTGFTLTVRRGAGSNTATK